MKGKIHSAVLLMLALSMLAGCGRGHHNAPDETSTPRLTLEYEGGDAPGGLSDFSYEVEKAADGWTVTLTYSGETPLTQASLVFRWEDKTLAASEFKLSDESPGAVSLSICDQAREAILAFSLPGQPIQSGPVAELNLKVSTDSGKTRTLKGLPQHAIDNLEFYEFDRTPAMHFSLQNANPGDFNQDGRVSGLDVFMLAERFGEHSHHNGNSSESIGNGCIDLNMDGVIDGQDLPFIALNYGNSLERVIWSHSNEDQGWTTFRIEDLTWIGISNLCGKAFSASDRTPLAGVNSYKVNLQGGGETGPDSNIVQTSVPLRLNAITPGSSTTGVGEAVRFSAELGGGSGAFDYNWSFGDGSGSSYHKPSHAYAEPGVYEIVLDISDRETSENLSHAFLISVQSVQNISLEYAGPWVIPPGQSLSFRAVPPSPDRSSDVSWYFGDGDFKPRLRGRTQANHAFHAPGIYPVIAQLHQGDRIIPSEPAYILVREETPFNTLNFIADKFCFGPGEDVPIHVFANIPVPARGIDFYPSGSNPGTIEETFYLDSRFGQPHFPSPSVDHDVNSLRIFSEQVVEPSEGEVYLGSFVIDGEWLDAGMHYFRAGCYNISSQAETNRILGPPENTFGIEQSFNRYLPAVYFVNDYQPADLHAHAGVQFPSGQYTLPVQVEASAYVLGNADEYSVTWVTGDGEDVVGPAVSLSYETPSEYYWRDKLLNYRIEENGVTERQFSESAFTFAVDKPLAFEFSAGISKTGDYIGPQYLELDIAALGFEPLKPTLLDIRFSDQTEDLLLERYHPIELNKGLMCPLGETDISVDLEFAAGGQLGSWQGSVNCQIPGEPPTDSLYLEFPEGTDYCVGDVIPVEIWLRDFPGDIREMNIDAMINGERFGGYLRFRSFEHDAEFWPDDTQIAAVHFNSGFNLLSIGAPWGLDSYPVADGPHRVATLYVRAKRPGIGIIVLLQPEDYSYMGTSITDSGYHDRSIEHLIGGQVTITE